MHFRIHEADDLDELVELHQHKDVFEGSPIPDFSIGWWWIATCEDAPVAFAGGFDSPSMDAAFYYSRVGVHPHYRGNQLQRRLTATLEKRARREGFEQIVTDVRKDLIHSSNNFARAGYSLFKPQFAWGLADSLYWRKEI
jgi:ribosomal protein S18 acetylase RimI-like enzyme